MFQANHIQSLAMVGIQHSYGQISPNGEEWVSSSCIQNHLTDNCIRRDPPTRSVVGGGLYREHAQQPAVKCPCTLLFGWRFAKRTLWNGLRPGKVYMLLLLGPSWNDCFSLTNYNDWLRWLMRVKESLTLYIHRFRLMGGDGGETPSLWVANQS